MSSSVPIVGAPWDCRSNDDFRFQALRLEKVANRQPSLIPERVPNALWIGLRNALIAEAIAFPVAWLILRVVLA
jgi:hypothetical protein